MKSTRDRSATIESGGTSPTPFRKGGDMSATARRTGRPWTFKYQWRRRGDAEWTDGESSAHSGSCLEMYKSPIWLETHPQLEHRIIAADGSVRWEAHP